MTSGYCGSTGEIPICGLELIKGSEEFHEEAYVDPLTNAEPITIGWGATRKRDGSPWHLGDRITLEEADELLLEQLEEIYLPGVKRIPCWNELNINQKGALLSFAYNLGPYFYGHGDFETITKILKNKQWERIEEVLPWYCNPGTAVEDGLRKRRRKEAKLFLTPPALNSPASSNVKIVFEVAVVNTWLKHRKGSAAELDNRYKVLVCQGDLITCDRYFSDENHWSVVLDLDAPTWKPHTLLDLDKRIGPWRIFKEHVRLQQSSPPILVEVASTTKPSGLNLGNDLASQIIKYMLSRGDRVDVGTERYNIIYVEGLNADGSLNSKKPDTWFSRRMIIEIPSDTPIVRLNADANTCPGIYYVRNPMNRLGAAYVELVQQKDVWVMGRHGIGNPHPALMQEGHISITRDLNKDFQRLGDKEYVGNDMGINQHWGYGLKLVGKASAGCLTGQDWDDHLKFINILKRHKLFRGNSRYRYTTTLIDAVELKKNWLIGK